MVTTHIVTIALSQQAAMLYVILYFVPDTLRTQTAFMREIVDKYFPDNWVISTYMGRVVWLPEAWDQYKAAKAAITNTTANNDVKRVAEYHGGKLRSLMPGLRELLTEGCITGETLLDNVTRVLTMIREANVSLRWLLLHCTTTLPPTVAMAKRCRQLQELVR